MKKAELIFVPSTSKGHLIPALEFAKRLVNHDDRISITIVSVNLPFDSFVDAYIKSVKASEPHRIKFIDVPQQKEHPSVVDEFQSLKAHIFALMNIQMPILKDVVTNILSSKYKSNSTQFTGLVFDLATSALVDIAHQFDVPSYIFLTSNGGFLSLLFHLTTRQSTEFKQTNPDELIPGFINPVPPTVLPFGLFDKDNGYIRLAQRLKTVKGIMVNTFEELEPYAINGFSNGGNPPIYPVGPVLDISCKPHLELDLAQHEKVMKWLDQQPRSSVVFLCFGSFGFFGASQVKEIALGLEQSGYRFLWSLRMQPSQKPQNDASKTVHSSENTLPEGFVERIQGRGIICEWAPQVEILAHKAIGGFVSHCGWNSILESLWFGVPMVTWPMYAEQQLNAFKMVKELGLAMELRLDYRAVNDDVVMADEIENAVKQVMDEGSEVRKKVKEMTENARKAIVNGGSSLHSIQKMIEDMIL